MALRSRMTTHVETDKDAITLFLVDDVPELRELIRYGMEEDPGFEVVGEAGDGRTAIEGISEKQPTAVLLDLSMPDMDGFAAIPELRSRHPEMAIVVLSGFPAIRMGDRARERGADGYVEKGTAMSDLRAVIREAVSARRGSE
jgi:DNA-binding NarL/FixJ family response regulator